MRRLVLGLTLLLPAVSWSRESLDTGLASRPVPMLGILALMALLPFAVMMLTSFSKIVVVLSIARTALGTQQAPPTVVLTGLAAVLTAHIMAPVVQRTYELGETAYTQVDSGAHLVSALEAVGGPLREFLVKHGNPEERARFVELARELRPPEEANRVAETDLTVVVPAFVITELKEAFVLGFLI